DYCLLSTQKSMVSAEHRQVERGHHLERAAFEVLRLQLLVGEAEVGRLRLARADRDRLRYALLILLVPRDQRGGARRDALDLELADRARDGEERMREHADPGAHPRVLVALDGDDRLGAL